jgi:hypothetical protein
MWRQWREEHLASNYGEKTNTSTMHQYRYYRYRYRRLDTAEPKILC